ncbi:MAG: UUP1 family membrane protein [Chromatiales bacterium]|nr:UUP1 family membrane protein [Chromatiales bacterium]
MAEQQKKSGRRRAAYWLLIGLLVVLPFGMMGFKLFLLDYPLKGLIPQQSYQVELAMEVDGHGDRIQMQAFLPRSDARQLIIEEQQATGLFTQNLQSEGMNRIASWEGDGVQGHQEVRYTVLVQSKPVRYELPEGQSIPAHYPPSLQPYLMVEEGIQVDSPLIAERVEQLLPATQERTLAESLTTIHRHLQDAFENRNFSGYTDALTALKLGEASCNGKGRLFVALARKLNIPARLVGGFIMEGGSKRTSHQWVEAYVNGHWVPFDTINDHYAEIPANYLTLYYGDEVLFKHSSNVNFQYRFTTTKRLIPRYEAQQTLGDSIFNLINFYTLFERVGISQDLLKVLLMIPLGAFVTVVFRNVIGIETFGTFLPALIAAAARETGLVWGLIGFILIITITALVRKGLDWLQLLHSPKMAVILAVVVVVMMMMTVTGVQLGLFELAQMTLFPIAILAITAERFAIITEEQGVKKALHLMATTAVVIAACYAVMSSLFMQSLFLAFPELLLVVMALNMWLGRWVGMRLMEYYRFRHLLQSGVSNA